MIRSQELSVTNVQPAVSTPEIARSEVTVTLITSFQFVSGAQPRPRYVTGIRHVRHGKKLACLSATYRDSSVNLQRREESIDRSVVADCGRARDLRNTRWIVPSVEAASNLNFDSNRFLTIIIISRSLSFFYGMINSRSCQFVK